MGGIRKKEEKKSTPFVCVCVVYAHLYYPSSFYLKNNFFGREKKRSTRWKRKENKTWRELLKDKMGERRGGPR
jgi:hypothetical protein